MIARSDGASLGRGFSTRSRISYTVAATWRAAITPYCHERARTEDGVAQAERLLLAHVGHRGQLGDRLDLRELLHLAAVVQVVLQLEGGVEVVLDRTLAATGHDDDLRE